MNDNICFHWHFVSCNFLGTFKLASAGPWCKVQHNVFVIVVVCAMGFHLAGVNEWNVVMTFGRLLLLSESIVKLHV
jgi:hypothetical protein